MKIQIRKLSIALVALGLSGVASAAMYAPPAPAICTGHNVVVPCEGTGWRIGITGLYVEQSTDDPYFAVVNTSTSTDTTSLLNSDFVHVDSDWNWGFKLEAAYIWRQGDEIALSWKRVHGDADESHFVLPDALIPSAGDPVLAGASIFTPYQIPLIGFNINADFPPVFEGGVLPIPAVGPITSIASRGHFDFDQVNAEIAKYLHMGDFVTARLNFGLSYLKLEHDVDTTFFGGVFIDDIEASLDSSYHAAISDNSRFNGVGLRTGLNANWSLFRGDAFTFGIIGEANAGLYAGDIKNTIDAIVTATTITSVEVEGDLITTTVSGNGAFRAHYEDDKTIVPEGEAKLGLGLGYMMGDAGRIELNGGWETQGVFHAVKHFGVVSNYGHQGPFLQLQYVA